MAGRRFLSAFGGVGLTFGALAFGSLQASDHGAGHVTQERLLAADSDPANWLVHGRTWNEDRFSPLDQIDAGNVDRLGLAFAVEFDTNRGQEATPIVVDGVMYVSTAWSKVLALDAATGERLWFYDPEVDGAKGAHTCCDVVNRGVAVWDGKVFVGTIDGRLVALDAASGEEVWDVVTVDQSQPYTITSAPRVVKDKVIIGNSGAELGVRGYVGAYDVDTGEQVWRFYTVPGNPADGPDGAASDAVFEQFATDTWAGEWWEMGGGGTVWDSIVYDAELDQLLIGVGNGSPWNHRARSNGEGDNLFLASILSLDPDTGVYNWHYQQNPGETWDFTATQQMTLTDMDIGGESVPVVMQAPKNGFFYILDRRDGTLLSAEPYAQQNWAERIDMETGRPVEIPEARFADAPYLVTPSGLGAHAYHPMSYSPQTGLVYIPAMQTPSAYMDDVDYTRNIGRWNTGVIFLTPPEGLVPGDTPEARRAYVTANTKGTLLAWDPVAQEARWSIERDWPWNGGTLATAGNLVFQGLPDGTFNAYDARDGEHLWSFDGQRGIVAGGISYAVEGTQYVAIVAGYGGSMGMASQSDWMRRPPPNGMLFVFKLDGDAGYTPLPPHVPPPYVSTGETFSAETIATGQQAYLGFCTICHNGPVNPNLMRSVYATDADAWNAVVMDGLLSDNGMISFAPWIDAEQSEAIRAYVLSEAGRRAAEEETR
ncbi:PQQ-dependent dehydrogenase, methanol/ethanol family [Aurantiacibacter poecillastricola]|uniref:PQQ-dependent dehydrogenase, methanol/ethanol family n=1 Tax=Aurantiacibacter poecillastricola TaxID=3064385 RepID=UPI00273E4B22|nr:PQQ-dependent dehydrogenase, methanol/ethanol family [Aurantiacibacter sp. 219JJ12-13]MDP5262445.1 PQQ-dependent dehydrogenase, methanol/ethanol family [Aurantiacibacter sp. 219JJ12-13]